MKTFASFLLQCYMAMIMRIRIQKRPIFEDFRQYENSIQETNAVNPSIVVSHLLVLLKDENE